VTTTPCSQSLTIQLFGSVTATCGSQSLPKVRSRKGLWLLALLALRANQPVSRDWLAATLWPDSDDARQTLRRTLTDLKTALGPCGQAIQATTHTLTLNISPQDVDALAFDALTYRGGLSPTSSPSAGALTPPELGAGGRNPSASLARLDAAIQLYRAPLLQDCPEVWSDTERIPRAEAYLQALHTAARLHAQAHNATPGSDLPKADTSTPSSRDQLQADNTASKSRDLARAITYLRIGIAADPFREALYHDLMLALAANGEPAEAIQVYRQLRLFLHSNTRLEPSDETTRLYQSLQASGATRPPANSADPTARASDPDWQPSGLTARTSGPTANGSEPVARASVPVEPTRSTEQAERPGTNLPSPLTGILGRERELTLAASRLTDSRLVTLIGMGGLGKTRLAIETASRFKPQFPGGAWFVDLAAIVDPELVPRTLAAVLSVREEAGKPLPQTLVDVLRDRRTLIVMDNCEHLLEPCAALIRSLVTACPQLYVLATSRQALGITGEVAFRLEPLPLPDPESVISAAAPGGEEAIATIVSGIVERSPAVSLFVERVAAAQPGFVASPQNIGAISKICCRLDGIPLALELAAARARSLSVVQIASRLDDRFRLLTSPSRAAPPRQQALRALVDWSFDLLEPKERMLFARVSIFAGGWMLEACEEVCADAPDEDPGGSPAGPLPREGIDRGQILDLLSGLVEKSLVLAESGDGGETRYRMLETLRQYAAEKLLQGGERERMRVRHLRWCLRFTEEAESEMRGANQTQRLSEQMRDNDNLRQALQEAGPGVERMRLATALFWHWYVHGFYAEGRGWLERVLEQTPDAPVALRCKAMKTAGDLCWAMGDMEAAQAIHHRNLAVQCDANDRRGVGMTYNSLGLVAYHQGDCAKAIEYYEKGLRILRELDEASAVGVVLMNLALPLKEQGAYREAEALLSEADAIHRKTGNAMGLTSVLHSRCLIAKRLGDYERAKEFIEEAIEIDGVHANLLGEAVNLHTRGEIAFYQGDLELAERSFRGSLERFSRIGARRSIAAALCSLGEVLQVQGHTDEARRLQLESLDIDSALGNRVGMTTSLRALAAAEHSRGDSRRAATLLAAVAAGIEQLGTPMPPNQHEPYERLLADIRETLGEESYDLHWRTGAVMSLESAAELARSD